MRIPLAFLFCALTTLALTAIHPTETVAQEKNNALQSWEGTLDAGAAKLRLRFEIIRSGDNKFSGNMISVDQGNARVPVSEMSVDGDKVTMEFKTAGAKFEGTLNEPKNRCEGKWTQGGKSFDFTIKRMAPRNHLQSWQGELVAGKKTFDFQLRIETDEGGKQHCRLDSFTEKMFDIETVFEAADDGFKFGLPAIKANFTGKYNDDKSVIAGKWLQGGAELPLKFEKIPLDETRWSLPRPKRPQHPKAPFPYIEEEVTFENKTDKIKLAGTLTLPKGTGNFPAVVLVTGSGPQDRDETLFEHKPFLVIADHLTRNGIAVLRYDDRGVGNSGGKFAGATTEDFSRDAASAIEFLKSHDSIDPTKIGIVGHSEGGVIGPMLAARRDDVAFLVMLAGPGVSGAEISLSQSRAMSKAVGLPEDYLDTQDEALTSVIDATRSAGKPLTEKQISELLEKIAASSDDKRKHIELMQPSMTRLIDPWTASFILSDPADDLAKITCPVLALNGGKDLQVLSELNLGAIRKHLTTAGNKDFKAVELPGLNHLFQTAETGAMSEYADIEETFSPKALDGMTRWILQHTK